MGGPIYWDRPTSKRRFSQNGPFSEKFSHAREHLWGRARTGETENRRFVCKLNPHFPGEAIANSSLQPFRPHIGTEARNGSVSGSICRKSRVLTAGNCGWGSVPLGQSHSPWPQFTVDFGPQKFTKFGPFVRLPRKL